MLVAWGDESGSNTSVDPGSYILAVVVARAADADSIRSQMLDLRLKGQRKLHWRDEGAKRRAEIAAAVAGLPVEGVVVVRHRATDEAPERRRRKCMERLLHELDGCSRLVLESRGPRDDARDRAMVDALRRRRAVPAGLHTDHVPGPKDPALWAADALCGCVTEARSSQPSNLDVIRTRAQVRIIEI